MAHRTLVLRDHMNESISSSSHLLTLSPTKFMQLLSLANICSNAIEAMDVHNIKINIIAFDHRRISSSRTAQLRYSW